MQYQKPILVFGAGALFGHYVVPELVARGAKVRGAVHHEAGEAIARASCATEIVVGWLEC